MKISRSKDLKTSSKNYRSKFSQPKESDGHKGIRGIQSTKKWDQETNSSCHIIIKTLNTKKQRKNIKNYKGNGSSNIQRFYENYLRIAPDFLTETLKVRRAWLKVKQTLREHKCQTRLLYPAKHSISIDGETKICQDKTKFKHYLYLQIQPYKGSQKENSNTRNVHTAMKRHDISISQQTQKKRTTSTKRHQKKTGITGTNSHLTLKSLNINGLNSSIKIHKLTAQINKQDPALSYIQETHFINKDRHYLRVRPWKKVFQADDPKNKLDLLS